MKVLVKKAGLAELILAGAGLAALTVLYIAWWMRHPDMPGAGRWAAFVSAALFAALGVRFVFVWLGDWRSRMAEPQERRITESVRVGVLVRIFLACFAAEIAALLLVFVLQVMNGSRESFWAAAEIWTKLDSKHYFDIAREWYLSEGDTGRLVQLVFLPGYPLAVRLFLRFTGNILKAGLLVSALSFSGAGVMLYLLARLDTDHGTALRTVKYICLVPGAFFFAAPMSDALFLLLSVSCVYAARRGMWLPAGLLGGLAAFTRSLGLVLLAPMCFLLIAEAITRRSEPRSPVDKRRLARGFACLLLIPAGFGAYCLICRSVTGDAFKFMEYQREHWSQSPGLFFHTAAYQTENAFECWRERNLEKLIGLWLPNLFCIFAALLVMLLAVRRLHPAYTAYFIGYYVMAVGTSWLLSGPRYLAALFPLSMGLSALTEDRRTDALATVGLSVFYVLYAIAFIARWQVW